MSRDRLFARTPLPFSWTIAIALVLLISSVHAVDSDGDGLLDVIDAPEFDASATGRFLRLRSKGIEDLDGTNLLTNVVQLHLNNNRITDVENGDFLGLEQ